MRAAGVAMPKAQGQAMIRTETRTMKATANGIPPIQYHAEKAPTATSTTAGTK